MAAATIVAAMARFVFEERAAVAGFTKPRLALGSHGRIGANLPLSCRLSLVLYVDPNVARASGLLLVLFVNSNVARAPGLLLVLCVVTHIPRLRRFSLVALR